MAEFKAFNAIALAMFSNGQVKTVKTALKATGDYREWYEPSPCEWGYGWTESDFEIDEKTIEPLYPDEFESGCSDIQNSIITKIVKVIEEPNWEVQDGWEEDYQPDENDLYERLKEA